MKRKYLDDADISYKDSLPKNDDRRPVWANERKVYGFDSRETWNLNDAFLKWLYERVKMYIEINCVDLMYHKFVYHGKTLTQQEVLDLILKDIEMYYNVNGCFEKKYGNDVCLHNQKQFVYMREIGELWALVLPAMWW